MTNFKPLPLLAACLGLLFSAGLAAQMEKMPAAPAMPPAAAEAEEPIFGAQLMSPEERMAHRQKMRMAGSAEERERIRAEHHQQMLDRAKAQGKSLPDEPPPRGGMMGQGGPGPGPGMGGGPAKGAMPDPGKREPMMGPGQRDKPWY